MIMRELEDEEARILALKQYQVLDTPAEKAFDDLTVLAAHICQTPIALISLIDESRQWFKAVIGLDAQETPREIAFCNHAIQNPAEALVVHDATQDHRFMNNPLVVGHPYIRFYAGVPLVTSDGQALGTLCVIDHVPRCLEPAQLNALQCLSRQVMTQLELRRHLQQRILLHQQLKMAQAQTQLYTEIIKNVPLAIDVWQLDHLQDAQSFRLIATNPAGAKIWGLSRKEWIGQPISNIFPEAIKIGLHEIYAEIVRSQQGRDLGEVFYGEGLVRRSFAVKAFPLANQCVGVLYEDVTERKSVQEELRQKEEQYRSVFEATSDAFLIFDYEGILVEVNPAACKMHGYIYSEMIGMNGRVIVHPSHHLKFDAFIDIVSSGQTFEVQTTHLRKDGALLQVDMTGQAFQIAGQPYLLAVVRDITEKKSLEAQFLRTQRLESIGTLAGGISHDLNNVLTPILGAIQLLRLTVLDPQSQQWLDLMETSARRGADLVRQVLSFARGVEGDRVELQMHHILTEVVHIVRETFPKSIQVQSAIPAETGLVSGDVTQLHQIIMNLCVNARDAMSEAGVLRISAENCYLDEAMVQAHVDAKVGSYVVVTVADTGTGIAPDLLDKIFEPFFTTKEVGQGTGLGLSTAIGIIKSHGGFITVDSEIGRGSEFRVYLPAVPYEAIDSNQPPSIELYQGSGELILLVDDEDSIREMTRSVLEAYGYRVLLAKNGAEAIVQVARHSDRIAAVLLDAMMPIMDGAQTIPALNLMNPAIQIIAVSGSVSNGQNAALSSSNVKAFLSKPHTAEELLATLHQVLHSP